MKADAAKHAETVLSSNPRDYNDDKETKPHPDETKLDKHGLPLVPQPSDNEDDPLVQSHTHHLMKSRLTKT